MLKGNDVIMEKKEEKVDCVLTYKLPVKKIMPPPQFELCGATGLLQNCVCMFSSTDVK